VTPLTYDDQKSQRYNEIIEAAVKLFEEKGYKATSIRDIAASINLTQGTIYHYVRNKEELLFEINNRLISFVLANHEEILNMNASCAEKIRRVMKDIFNTLANHNAYVMVLVREYKNLSGENLKKIVEKRDQYEGVVKKIIEEGIKGKEFKDIDPKISAMALFGMCNWATIWLRPQGRLSVDNILDIFADIYLGGLTNPQGD
jgi:AcrR family transcriptional regulator